MVFTLVSLNKADTGLIITHNLWFIPKLWISVLQKI